MSRSSTHRLAAAMALAAVLAIVYGSLYPFEFRPPAVDNPLAALWATRQFSLDQTGNLIGNLFFYLPLGLFGGLALGRPTLAKALLSVIIGLLLSIGMELTQFCVVGRVSTFNDIYPNATGTAFGVCLAFIVSGISQRLTAPRLAVDPAALLLLALFFAYRLFPYVPSLDPHQYWHAIKPLLHLTTIHSGVIADYGIRWLVVAELITCIVGRRYGIGSTIVVMAGIFTAKVVIVHNALSPAEPIGALAAVFVGWMISTAGPRLRAFVVFAMLVALVGVTRLQPFEWQATAQAFGWVPFASLLHGSMTINTLSLLEKCFLYGSLVWLLQRLGSRLILAGGLIALMLFAASLIETHLPGRSAEVTDAILALLMTAVLGLMGQLSSVSGARPRPIAAR